MRDAFTITAAVEEVHERNQRALSALADQLLEDMDKAGLDISTQVEADMLFVSWPGNRIPKLLLEIRGDDLFHYYRIDRDLFFPNLGSLEEKDIDGTMDNAARLISEASKSAIKFKQSFTPYIAFQGARLPRQEIAGTKECSMPEFTAKEIAEGKRMAERFKADRRRYAKPQSFGIRLLKNTAASAFGVVAGIIAAPSIYNYVANIDTKLNGLQTLSVWSSNSLSLFALYVLGAPLVLSLKPSSKSIAPLLLGVMAVQGSLLGYFAIEKHKTCLREAKSPVQCEPVRLHAPRR